MDTSSLCHLTDMMEVLFEICFFFCNASYSFYIQNVTVGIHIYTCMSIEDIQAVRGCLHIGTLIPVY